MLILEMASESRMLGELSVAIGNRTIKVISSLDVSHGMLLHLVLSEELLEAISAFVGLHPTVSHSVAMHVRHLANVALIHCSLVTFMSFLKTK